MTKKCPSFQTNMRQKEALTTHYQSSEMTKDV